MKHSKTKKNYLVNILKQLSISRKNLHSHFTPMTVEKVNLLKLKLLKLK